MYTSKILIFSLKWFHLKLNDTLTFVDFNVVPNPHIKTGINISERNNGKPK
jgi:hypothetical protein